MPYRLDPSDRRCVQVQRPSGWQRLKCHAQTSDARDHLTALRLNVLEAFDSSVPPRSYRKLGTGVNARLMDALLRHRHWLLLAENGIARDAASAYREASLDILLHLTRLAEKDGAISTLQRMRLARLRVLHQRIDDAVQIAGVQAEAGLVAGLTTLAQREAAFQARLLQRTLPTGLALNLEGPDIQRVQAILSEPLGGRVYGERFARNHGEARFAMRRSLATSFALGEGMDSAARRLRRHVDTILINRAVQITRSEMQRVANRTAQQTYLQNADVLKGIMIVETLDVRTCLLCIQQDGKVFGVSENPGSLPPYHPGCRGFITPVTRSFEELGLVIDEFPPGTRASMNGEVPATVTYRDWFPDQPAEFQREVLGPTRYRLWKSGQLEIDDMVKSMRVLPVSELPVAA